MGRFGAGDGLPLHSHRANHAEAWKTADQYNGGLMRSRLHLLFFILALFAFHSTASGSGGITPEQIFQNSIDWQSLIATWEALPEEHPLGERDPGNSKSPARVLMTLRKDGTCRVFNQEHPMGSDGLWTFEGHEMFMSLPGGSKMELFVYGIKGDFMVTRSPIQGGRDQLWARVK